MNYFKFGEKSSALYRLGIEGEPTYAVPRRKVEIVSVPGRNGDLIWDSGAYENVDLEYKISVNSGSRRAAELARSVADWLQGSTGYQRLEDSYHPDEYRLAMFVGPLDLEIRLRHYGFATLSFSALPQRFLKCGETPQDCSSGTVLLNHWMDARPVISVTGAGSGILTVGDYTAELATIPAGGITLDCEGQDCFSGDTNVNRLVSLSGGTFPLLKRGPNEITFYGGITAVRIVPRWWVL